VGDDDDQPPAIMIHRDIKSANILLDGEQARARLADFGIARNAAFARGDEDMSTKTFTMTTNRAGTAAYMAPEYLSSGELSPKVDIFSMGVVMLEVMAWQLVVVDRQRRPESLIAMLGPVLTERGGLLQTLAELNGLLATSPVPAGEDDEGNLGWPTPVLLEFAALANSCLSPYRRNRPSAAELAERLEQLTL
jgi:serine/threonine protein kinase